MNLLDLIVVAIIALGAYKGWKYGGFTTAVSLLGTIAIFVIAYYLKNPLSVLMYENLPFRTFGGIFAGVTSFNILVYEGIAYLICISILTVILKVVLKATGIIDKLLSLTLVFALPSKIAGLIIGGLEYFVYAFVILFIMSVLPFSASYFNDSTVAVGIVKNTPLLSNVTNDLYSTVSEVYDVCSSASTDEEKAVSDYESLEILMKNGIITSDSAQKLVDKGKLDIDNVDELISKYAKDDK